MRLSRPQYQRLAALVAVVAAVVMTGCDDDSELESVPTAEPIEVEITFDIICT
jgi:hypothetical protein